MAAAWQCPTGPRRSGPADRNHYTNTRGGVGFPSCTTALPTQRAPRVSSTPVPAALLQALCVAPCAREFLLNEGRWASDHYPPVPRSTAHGSAPSAGKQRFHCFLFIHSHGTVCFALLTSQGCSSAGSATAQHVFLEAHESYAALPSTGHRGHLAGHSLSPRAWSPSGDQSGVTTVHQVPCHTHSCAF